MTRGRPRSPKKKSLPPHLYERGGYYSWRDPMTGKEWGLGNNRAQAIAEAIEANIHIAGLSQKRRLVDRLQGIDGDTVADWCDRYLKSLETKLEKGDIAKATYDNWRQHIRRLESSDLGNRQISKITTRDMADYLSQWSDAGKMRSAQAIRSLLIKFFNAAMAAGWVEKNPLAPTERISVEVTRARLTLEQFQKIHAFALEHSPPWVARSMELAIVTGQRREDVRNMGPSIVRDGRLWIEQEKTGNRICIPLSIRLHAVNLSLGEAILKCRDRVLSKHFVHHSTYAGRAKPGDPVRRHTITAEFAAARNACGLTWPDGTTPPSFHEIRSLSARLYDEQGVNAQLLLGHKHPEMTALYKDARGAEWVEVRTS